MNRYRALCHPLQRRATAFGHRLYRPGWSTRRYNGRRGLDAALLRTVLMGRAMRPVSGSPLSMTIMFLTESGKTKSLERLPLRTWPK